MSFNDFHIYVTSKGYKFYQIEEDETRSYAYKRSRTNIYASRVVSKYSNPKTKKQKITFQTLTSGDYLNIENQLKPLSFDFINTQTSKKGTKFLIYRKDKTEVTLASNQDYNSKGEKFTYYQISVTSAD